MPRNRIASNHSFLDSFIRTLVLAREMINLRNKRSGLEAGASKFSREHCFRCNRNYVNYEEIFRKFLFDNADW